MSDYFILGLGVIFNVLAQIFLKMGMKNFSLAMYGESVLFKLKEIITNFPLVFSVLLYGLGFVAYAIALKNIELSKAYPVASVAMILLIFVISILFLGESLNSSKIIGIVLSILGIFFILLKG